MMSMLSTIIRQRNKRPVMFIHATRNGRVHAMKDYLPRSCRTTAGLARHLLRRGGRFRHQGVRLRP
jgi:ferredoxin-NADP reductase